MQLKLTLKMVSFGVMDADDGSKVRYASIEASDSDMVDKNGKTGFPDVKYKLVDSSGEPCHVMAEQLKQIIQRVKRPVELEFEMGMIKGKTGALLCVKGFKLPQQDKAA